VIEFVHTASLLHDDVVDNARLRRGQEAANLVFGNQASVLVGDFLYGRASSMLADDGDIRR
jgi:octaprenyl-diphosphate synthase